MLTDPDSTFKDAYDDDMGEIAYRYRGNHIQLEHRYFDYSAPYECWKMLDYCTAEEAAEDFHAIIGALKEVFTGKWVISGVSKGGITTALQYLYHPEDADIFMPYAAPFYDTDRDSLTLHYWFNNGWNKNYLDRFMNVRRQAVSDKAHIYPIYEKMAAGNDDSPGHLDSVYGSYMSAIAQFGYQEHTYGDTVSIRKQIYRNDSILRRYNKQYEDTVYAYMIAASTYSLDMFQPWLDTLRVYSDRKQGPRRVAQMQHYAPFGVTEKDWANDDGSVSTAAYYYQAQCELGYYDCRFEEIAADEQTGAEWNRYWKEHFGCLLNFISPCFRSRTFSPSLYNRMMDAAKNATKPLLFLYGLDDTWTGAAIKDDFLNGTYSRKFILPAQNHNVCVSSNTDPVQCAEIKRIMDEVLGAPQGIEQPAMQPETGKARKFLKDGQEVPVR